MTAYIAMTASCRLTDLDKDPQFLGQVLRMFKHCMPGRNHAVCGDPTRMARTPVAEDFTKEALGVLLLAEGNELRAAMAICPYSDHQVTLWGPVVNRGYIRHGYGRRLLQETRSALADGGFESIRTLVDIRNRAARSFALAHGLKPWRENAIYEIDLLTHRPPAQAGVSIAQAGDLNQISHIIREAFPGSEHCSMPLTERMSQGYRYYIMQDSGHIMGTAAILRKPGRTWMHLIAIDDKQRGQGYGRRLLQGIISGEAIQGMPRLGLEVMTDNEAAVNLYRSLGFRCLFTATIMAGPV